MSAPALVDYFDGRLTNALAQLSGADTLSWGASGIPLVAVGVLVLLLGLIFWVQWRAARRRDLARLGPLGRVSDVAPIARDVVRAGLVVLSATLLVVAIARPRWGTSEESVKALGIDVAFVLDASKSMKLNDVVPDRLGAARFEIERTLDALHGGRAAFIPFAGLAFEQTGLTGDTAVLKSDLDNFKVEDMPRGGTAIGRGLAQALATLSPEERPANAAPADTYEKSVTPFEGAKHKAIVLFTDGEDHEGDAIAAAEEANKRGIKVFTVGVGTPQGRPVLEIDDEGRVTGTVKGPDGTTPLFSSLNVKLLKDIAAKTGGDYFLLGPDGLGDGLVKALGALEKAEYSTVYQDLGEERFEWAAVPALALLGIELWLSGRRKRRRS
jgi:Ca-activated chloride channel family protein